MSLRFVDVHFCFQYKFSISSNIKTLYELQFFWNLFKPLIHKKKSFSRILIIHRFKNNNKYYFDGFASFESVCAISIVQKLGSMKWAQIFLKSFIVATKADYRYRNLI